MGWVYRGDLERGGAHLLSILKVEGSVRYSRFYGSDVDEKALAAATSLDEDHAHVIIELAAGQLADAGIVSFGELPEVLINGEQDFTISLTDRGRKMLQSGQQFRYQDMHL